MKIVPLFNPGQDDATAGQTVGRLDLLTDQLAAHLSNESCFIDQLSRKVLENLNSPEFFDIFKKLVAAEPIERRAQEIVDTLERQNSPFAPIFIADLAPDQINAKDVEELEALSKISDVSEGVRFEGE